MNQLSIPLIQGIFSNLSPKLSNITKLKATAVHTAPSCTVTLTVRISVAENGSEHAVGNNVSQVASKH
jgi:hypothetical protein